MLRSSPDASSWCTLGIPSNERSDVAKKSRGFRPHGFQVKKMEYGRREETQILLKSVQPVDFLCFVSFFHEKEMKSPSRLERIGVWGQAPKKEN